MATQFLDLPWDIRRHVLDYSIQPDGHYVCSNHLIDERGFNYPARGFNQNPTLTLHLVCSQLHSEIRDFDKRWLSLHLCDEDCAEQYLEHYPEVVPFIRSIRFTSQFHPKWWDVAEETRRRTDSCHEQFGVEWDIDLGLDKQRPRKADTFDKVFGGEPTGEPIRSLFFAVQLERR